jgi:hypothetical protein
MPSDEQQAKAAYKVQDFEFLLEIALRAISERDRLLTRLESFDQLLKDSLKDQVRSVAQPAPPRVAHPRV